MSVTVAVNFFQNFQVTFSIQIHCLIAFASARKEKVFLLL